MKKVSVECVETINHYMNSDRFKDLPVSSRALFLSLVMYEDSEKFKEDKEWLSITKKLGYSFHDISILIAEGYFIKRKDGKLHLSDNN